MEGTAPHLIVVGWMVAVGRVGSKWVKVRALVANIGGTGFGFLALRFGGCLVDVKVRVLLLIV